MYLGIIHHPASALLQTDFRGVHRPSCIRICPFMILPLVRPTLEKHDGHAALRAGGRILGRAGRLRGVFSCGA